MTPAEAYAEWRQPSRIDEAPGFPPMPELELQARWFAGQFPRHLQTTSGEPVEIVHLGVWNREPGPDFCEAVIRLGLDSPKRGSIEIDTHRRDWETHGHATNPAFNDVVLHLFAEPGSDEFFTRTEENKFVPQIRLQLDSEIPLPTVPPLASLGRCAAPLANIPEDIRTNLIESAAHFRLQQKAEKFNRLASVSGWDEALFQTLAITLGYKENKLPFQLLAQRIGLKMLRENSVAADSLLFGCAGFLDATSLREFPAESQRYLQNLWEHWWKVRPRWDRFILTKSSWKLTGTRPANHPQRRLAALGLIALHWKKIAATFRECDLTQIQKLLGNLQHDYWNHHYTIRSTKSVAPIAMLGASRILEMFINAAIPANMASHPDCWRLLEKVRQPLENRKLKTGILRLFGIDSNSVGKTVLQQQGILQIYEDFCLRDFSDCARCPFPNRVLHWEKS